MCHWKYLNNKFLDIIKYVYENGRRKKVDIVKEVGPLDRDFNTADATLMSIASCLSYYFYTELILDVHELGPIFILGIIGSLIITSVTAMCFAELVAVHPVMGGSYHYSYRYIGEFIGFMVGWAAILNFFNNCASMISGCSEGLDIMFFDNQFNKISRENLRMDHDFVLLRKFPNLLSLSIGISFAGSVSAKTKETKIANNIATVINLCALFTMIILMSGQANSKKLLLDITEHLKGESSIFWAISAGMGYFNGIDGITLLGDEVKKPHVAMPTSIIYSLIACNAYYVSLVLLFTMVMSDEDTIPINSWITLLYQLKVPDPAWILKIGSISAIYCSIFTKLFWLTRILHAMSRDGLLFHVFSKIAHTSGVPVFAAFYCGVSTGLYSTFIDVKRTKQIEVFMAAITQIMAPICLLLSRYSSGNGEEESGTARVIFLNHPPIPRPTVVTEQVSSLLITVIVVTLGLLGHVSLRMIDYRQTTYFGNVLLVIVSIVFLIALFCLTRQPQHKHKYFQLRLVPLIPCIDIFLLVMLMDFLLGYTWKIVAVYFSIGVLFYLTYSTKNSKQRYEHRRGRWYEMNNLTKEPQPKVQEAEIEAEKKANKEAQKESKTLIDIKIVFCDKPR